MADTTIDINKSNAYDTYSRYRRGELDLSKAQVAECESYLTAEEEDEINYSEEVRQHDAASKIDTENEDGKTVKDNGALQEIGSTGASATAAFGSVAAVYSVVTTAKNTSTLGGVIALPASIIAAAGGAVALAMSYRSFFDNQLPDRLAKKEQSEKDNQTMDQYSDALAGSMEMMAEDEKLYQEQAQLLTLTRNQQTSRNAELQMQYDTAVEMGDTAGAESAKAEMQQLQNTDNSELEGELAETAGAIGEYRTMNAESIAIKESGQTVCDFLKKGHPKATLAYVNATLCLAGVGVSLLAAAAAFIPKFTPFDVIPSFAAGTFFLACAALMGYAGINFLSRGSEERQCGNSGETMQTDHINALNEMISAQDSRTNDTESVFGEIDTEATTAQGNAETSANTAIEQNNKILGNNSGAGTGAGSGSGSTGTGGGTGEG